MALFDDDGKGERGDKAERAEAARQRARFLATFGTEHGQAVLGDIRRYCRLGECVFSADGRVTAFEQGRQDVALWIEKLLKEKERD